MMLNEVWTKRRLALTTLAGTAVCLCYVVVLNKHCHTHVHIHTYLYTHTHTQSLPGSVFWSGADRASVVWQGSVTHMLSVYVVLTGLLWSASLRPDTICHTGTPIVLCLFPKHFFSRPSPPLNLTSFSPSFNILILLKNCLCLGCRRTDKRAFGYTEVHGVKFCVQSVFLASIYSSFLPQLTFPPC